MCYVSRLAWTDQTAARAPFTRLPVQLFIGWSAPDTSASLLVDAKIAVLNSTLTLANQIQSDFALDVLWADVCVFRRVCAKSFGFVHSRQSNTKDFAFRRRIQTKVATILTNPKYFAFTETPHTSS
jgi:hypothetical protein